MMYLNHMVYISIYVYTLVIWHDLLCLNRQDTVIIVPLYLYCIEEDRHNVPLEDCWYALPYSSNALCV